MTKQQFLQFLIKSEQVFFNLIPLTQKRVMVREITVKQGGVKSHVSSSLSDFWNKHCSNYKFLRFHALQINQGLKMIKTTSRGTHSVMIIIIGNGQS